MNQRFFVIGNELFRDKLLYELESQVMLELTQGNVEDMLVVRQSIISYIVHGKSIIKSAFSMLKGGFFVFQRHRGYSIDYGSQEKHH